MLPARHSESFVREPLPTRRIAASVTGLSKKFGSTPVLKDINFDIAEGETLVLLGASGSGKTTILRAIAGLEQPDAGRVILHGKDVTELPARQRGVGVIFQSYALFPQMTVEQNIGYGLKIRRKSRTETRATVDRLLDLVRLQDHRGKYPAQLSGGQQQRVAIARTLAYQPDVLLFDEPFGALDVQTRTHLRSEIRALLRKVNVPSIFITHDQEEALELGDRIAVIHAGQIEQIGTPQEVYDHSATEYVARFLGRANLLPAVVRNNQVQVGVALLPVAERSTKFVDGEPVNLVFRPEDVRLTLNRAASNDCVHLSSGIVTEINFAGAYERLSVRARVPGQRFDSAAQNILVTRLKGAVNGPWLKVGDEVQIALASFTILPLDRSSGSESSLTVREGCNDGGVTVSAQHHKRGLSVFCVSAFRKILDQCQRRLRRDAEESERCVVERRELLQPMRGDVTS